MQYYNQRIVNKVETDKINLEVEKEKNLKMLKRELKEERNGRSKKKTRIETEKRMKEKQALVEKEAKAKAERLEKKKIEAEKKKAGRIGEAKRISRIFSKIRIHRRNKG